MLWTLCGLPKPTATMGEAPHPQSQTKNKFIMCIHWHFGKYASTSRICSVACSLQQAKQGLMGGMPTGSPLNICITQAGCTSKALLTQRWKQPGLFLALVCRRKDSLVALPSHSEAFYSLVVKQPRKIIQTDLGSERRIEWQLFLSWAPLSNGVCLNPFCSAWDIPPEKAPFPAPLSPQLPLRCSLLPAPVSRRDAI